MFNFPRIPRKPGFQYQSNLLRSVTFQLRYPQNISFKQCGGTWKRALQDKYPNSRDVIQGKFKVTFQEKTPVIQQPESSAAGFELRSKDGQRVVTVTEDAFTITILGSGYSNFERTFSDLQTDFFPLLQDANACDYTRVAIRKVNLVEFVLTETCSSIDTLAIILNKSLVDNLLYFPCQGLLSSGITKTSFKNGEYQLNIVYGLLEKKQSLPHNQALLDIDLFKRIGITNMSELFTIMSSINEEIFNIFHWAFQRELLEQLTVQEAVSDGVH